MMVPTVDTARYGYFLERLLSVQKPVLFTGGTGVGKSVIVRDLLDHISERMNYVPVYINFSAQTSSGRTQEIIEGKLEKRKKNVIGAPQGKRVVIFIDDLNMPKLDTYGSQPPIELLRQYLDFDGLYDRETMTWKEIQDVTLAAACSPPGGGRNPVSPRLFRHFSMFTIPSPTEMSLKQMFLITYGESGIYYPPLVKTLATVKAYIESLPLIDEPEIFGLHENANIAFQLNETNALLATILDVQPRIVAADGGMSNDDITYELAEAVLDRLIDKLDIERANPNMFTPDAKGRINSLTIVLMQETERFKKLLIIIKTSLEQLKKAIKGFVVMSEELENVYNAFLNNHVPELWARNAYPLLKSLASWVKDLIMRCCFIDNWINNGPPKSFWLSGFFFPQGFLTGTLQNFARKYNQPIDHLSFKFILLPYSREEALVMEQLRTVKKGETIPMDQNLDVPDDGVLVHGLYMDGFAWDWDHMTVGDQLKGQMQANLPVMHMDPRLDYEPDLSLYPAPLYKTAARAGTLSTTGHSTNFVVTVHLPSSNTQDYWIAKGAALLCQISD
nr:dynein heavy chain 6; axonemal [Biomphalaria glabrata]